jgi:hypothetical protein
MAIDKDVGYKKAYKMTGTPGYAGDTAVTDIDPGKGGSHRDGNWKIGAKQAKLKNAGKIGPNENVTEYTK